MKRVLNLTSILVFAISGYALDDMSREEKTVRETYAKLAFAAQLDAVNKAILAKPLTRASLDERLRSAKVRFDLSNFVVGNIKDLTGRNYSEMLTRPMGEDVLQITPGQFKFTEELDETVETIATIRWEQGPNVSGENWDQPAAGILAHVEDAAKFSRYAAYTVTVTFAGRSRTYNAFFMFGQSPGDGEIRAIDMVSGNSALTFFAKETVYPALLLETKWRGLPIVAEWLRANEISDPACRSGRRSVCCDPSTLKCGVAAEDVRSALAKPLARSKLRPSSPVPLKQAPQPTQAWLKPAKYVLPAFPALYLGACEDYDYSTGPYPYGELAYEEHYSGSHNFAASTWGSCSYTGDTGQCNAHATAEASAGLGDSGTTYGYCHVPGWNQIGGTADGTAPTASSIAAGAIRTCFFCNCSTTVTMGPLSFPADSIHNFQRNYSNTCISRNNSPIIIDTANEGFQLTSVEGGVTFDIRGDGRPIQIAWTRASSKNAFLVLDRDVNGTIDGGKELFGNYAQQPQSDDPNGFLALAVYDSPQQGGNGDAVIDERDAIWPRLRLWIDENHNGKSETSELYQPGVLGVKSIDLSYKESRRKDEFGNLFRYKGTINLKGGSQDDGAHRVVYDVFLLGGK